MNTSHKVGLATLLLLTLGSVAACSSDENAGPTDGAGGTTIIPATGGSGAGSSTGGADGSGANNQGGDTGSGGQNGTGGFVEPPNPDCNEEDDFNEADECWDIHERPCNGQENIHFFNQCTDGGFCGDEAFDNSQIQGWSGGALPTPT
jgi:hypothetical protein